MNGKRENRGTEEAKKMGKEVRMTGSRRILTPASGYLSGYDYSLNPYAGCVFACSYCYVRALPVALFRGKPWGDWVDVKQTAAEHLRKELRLAKRKGSTAIFMSSSTDPYQPLEREHQITRSLLEAMTENPPDFLFVQTRSPLVVRDIDLLRRLGSGVRVSMTVETDLEPVRKAFTPKAPPIPDRLQALKRLKAAGVPVQAAVAPILPYSGEFPRLLSGAVDIVCLDDFFMGDGSNGKRTERLGIAGIFSALGMQDWYDRTAYLKLKEQLAAFFPEDRIRISRAGFMP